MNFYVVKKTGKNKKGYNKYYYGINSSPELSVIQSNFDKNVKMNHNRYKIVEINHEEHEEFKRLRRQHKNRKFGVWNTVAKEFQFGIREIRPYLAEQQLFKKIGNDARKYRFEIRVINNDQYNEMVNRHAIKIENHKLYKELVKPYLLKKKKRKIINQERQKEIGKKFKEWRDGNISNGFCECCEGRWKVAKDNQLISGDKIFFEIHCLQYNKLCFVIDFPVADHDYPEDIKILECDFMY